MSRLEDLQPNAAVRAILPDALVTVVSAQWFGSEALELTTRTRPAGSQTNCSIATTSLDFRSLSAGVPGASTMTARRRPVIGRAATPTDQHLIISSRIRASRSDGRGQSTNEGLSTRQQCINALRAETLEQRPLLSDVSRQHRWVVPADGFFHGPVSKLNGSRSGFTRVTAACGLLLFAGCV